MTPRNNKNILNWGECYYDHFEKHLGKPVDRIRFFQNERSSRPWMQIISYDNIFEGCRAFCSLGLSNYGSQIGKIAEIFMPVDEAWEDTPSILAAVLSHLIQRRLHIGRGTTVNFSNVFPDFVAQFGKTTIYFAEPFGTPEDFERVKCGSDIGEVFLASYISEAEYRFLKEYGAEKFEALLEEKQVDVFNIKRPSSI